MIGNQAQPESAAAAVPNRRWRFSIRQLMLWIAVVAVGLFIYREVPDMIRREVLNDPLPLHVGDRRLVHVRRTPYMQHTQFAARVFLPAEQTFELCIGLAKASEVYPEPQIVRRVNVPDSLTRSGQVINAECEWRFLGHAMPVQSKSGEECSYHVHVNRRGQSSGPLSFTYSRGRSKNYGRGTYNHMRGWRNTEAIPAGENLILYREYWESSLQNEYSPGTGLVVWLRPLKLTNAKD